MTFPCPVDRKVMPAGPMSFTGIGGTAPLKTCRKQAELRDRGARLQCSLSATTGSQLDRTAWAQWQLILIMMAGRTFTWLAIPLLAFCIATITTARFAKSR